MSGVEYLLVVYFLINGDWVRGENMPIEGWSAVAYPTKQECLASKERAEAIHDDLQDVNPRVYDKRYECVRHEEGSDG